MNNAGRILLLVGVVVLALLIGVLVGRSHRVAPTAARESAPAAVQITTAPPPSAAPPAPLPAPVKAPQPIPIPQVAPDVQVQEDAAAVGMTTRQTADQGNSDAAAPKSAASGEDAPPPPPNG
jgi:hypothetical protein